MDVRRVSSDDELDDALAVRRDVFVREQGVPEHLEIDGEDADALHFVAYDDGDPAGAARLRQSGATTGKVERVAVVRSRRGEGIGRSLVNAVEAAAVEEGYDELVLHAQESSVEFYERLGYEITSETFEEAGMPHKEMRKRP